jgi:hypothetical protein
MTNSRVATARKDRLLQDRDHDPYKSKSKPPEPSVCPVCQAVFQDGRWQWLEVRSSESRRQLCQACQRIRDNYPAGLLTVTGSLIKSRRTEILGLISNHARGERAQHPLHRIIRVEDQPDMMVVSTTDVHLPRRIGNALHHAYTGKLELQYDKANCFVRVNWNSNP